MPNSIASLISINLAVALSLVVSNTGYASEQRILPFQAVFSVGNDFLNAGDAKLTLEENNGLWKYSLITVPRGVFKLTGKGNIAEKSSLLIFSDNGEALFQPESYSYRQDNEARRSVDAAFNWADNSVTYTRRGNTETLDLEEPILDRLSVTLAVMQALKAGFETAEFSVFEHGSIKTIRFSNEGTETLNTQLGSFDTIRVKRQTLGGSSRHSLVWFAPLLDFVPVKLEQYKRGELVARMKLVDLKEP